MRMFRSALVVACCAVLAVVVRGGDDWRAVVFSAVVGLLVAAMLETMPLVDWLYPKDTDAETDDGIQ